MTQPSVEDVLARIRKEAEERATDNEVRWVRTCREGDEIRQGDIYLYPLDSRPPDELRPRSSLQLAVGTGPGSRHVIAGDAAAHDRVDRSDPLMGPVLQARERVTLTHPEHADISLPAGWYEVRYQRDFSIDPRVIRRVLD